MNVIQKPGEREFTSSMAEIVIDTDVSINFCVKKNGKVVMDETFVPDAKNQVRVRKIGKFLGMGLWGEFMKDDRAVFPQNNSWGNYQFLVDGKEIEGTTMAFIGRMNTKKEAQNFSIFSEVDKKVTHWGCREYVTGMQRWDLNGETKAGVAVWIVDDNGKVSFKEIPGNTMSDIPMTFNVSPNRIKSLFGGTEFSEYGVDFNNETMRFFIDRKKRVKVTSFRFLNVFDMPETIHCTGAVNMSASNKSESGKMYGVTRKFAMSVTDEYTVNSGDIWMQSDYKLWRNFMNAQQAEVLVGDAWLPIEITKQKFERSLDRKKLKWVEFSFKMANEEDNYLMDVD